MYKIMIIEDDITIAKALTDHLCKWNYDVNYVTDFKNITEQVFKSGPQLILLDVMLTFFNGFYWCGEIRKISKVPIMFISSISDNMNIVMAMNMGGDDFIAKPFDLNVLTAKVGALIRRTYSFQGQVNVIEHNGVVLNLSDATLTYHNQKIELTKNDYKILQLLMENIGKVVSREEIMQRLWESDEFIDDNTLTVNVTSCAKNLQNQVLKILLQQKKALGTWWSDMKNFISILRLYLKRNIVNIIVMLGLVGIFFMVFSLYSLPVEAVVYAALLSGFFILIIGIIGFEGFYKKHLTLIKLRNSIAISDFMFPASRDMIEKGYQELIKIIDKNRAEI